MDSRYFDFDESTLILVFIIWHSNISNNLVFVDFDLHHENNKAQHQSFDYPSATQIICYWPSWYVFVISTNHCMARFNLKQVAQCSPNLVLYLWIASKLLLGVIRKSQTSSVSSIIVLQPWTPKLWWGKAIVRTQFLVFLLLVFDFQIAIKSQFLATKNFQVRSVSRRGVPISLFFRG